VPAEPALAAACVGGMEEFVEGCAHLGGAVHVSQVCKTADRRLRQISDQPFSSKQECDIATRGISAAYGRVETVPRSGKTAEKLDGLGIPSRDVRGDLFQDAERALAAPVIDGVGDVDPLPGSVQPVDQSGIDQVGNVGNDPIVTSLDRLVFPQPVDVSADHGGRGSDAVDHFAQRTNSAKLVGIQRAIYSRKQIPEFIGKIRGIVVGRRIAHGATAPLRLKC
jgi:hypothetical protein